MPHLTTTISGYPLPARRGGAYPDRLSQEVLTVGPRAGRAR